MRGQKIRDIDYSYNELCKDIGIKPENLKNSKRFNRVLELYEFELENFKKSNENKEDYMFAIEWYPLIKTLINNIENNPFYRKNFNEKNIDAKKIQEYLSGYLDEIEDYDEYIKKLIEHLPIYLDTLKIEEYLPMVVEKLSQFIIAIIKDKNGEVGTTLKYIYEKLDYSIYYLFRNNYYKELLEEPVQDNIKKDINKANIPIDSIIAELLKLLMKDTSHLNSTLDSIDEFEDISDEMLFMLGLKRVNENGYKGKDINKKEDVFIKRELYKQMLKDYYISDLEVKNSNELIENYKNRKVKSIKDKILNNELLKHEEDIILYEELQQLEIEKNNIENKIKNIKQMINTNKKNIKIMDESNIKDRYLVYIDNLEKESEELNDASNYYIGQAILPYIKADKNIK